MPTIFWILAGAILLAAAGLKLKSGRYSIAVAVAGLALLLFVLVHRLGGTGKPELLALAIFLNLVWGITACSAAVARPLWLQSSGLTVTT